MALSALAGVPTLAHAAGEPVASNAQNPAATPPDKKTSEQLRKEALAAQKQKQEAVAQAAFLSSLHKVPAVALSPGQINTFSKMLFNVDKAVHAGDPQLGYGTIRVSTQPGALSPVIVLHGNVATALLFVDQTGASWPIGKVTVGQHKWFQVQQVNGSTNEAIVSAMVRYGNTNLIVNLKGRSTPVLLTLSATPAPSDPKKGAIQHAVMTVAVPGMGPEATPPVIGPAPNSALNGTLQSFIDGIPPSGSKVLALSGAPQPTQAWSYKDYIYLRTQNSLVWPAWVKIGRSSDGTRVYKMPKVPSLLMTADGTQYTVTVGNNE